MTFVLLSLLAEPLAAQHEFDAGFVRYEGLRYACDGSFTPVVAIKNLGSSSMNSCVVDTWKNGLQVGSFNWVLAVAAVTGETRRPALPGVSDVLPGDVLEFRIISVNGQADQGLTDNVLQVVVEEAPPVAESYVVRVAIPAAFAGGTSWRVMDAAGMTVAQGGPYTGGGDAEAWVTLEDTRCYALELTGEAFCEGRLFSDGNEVIAVTCGSEAGIASEGFLTGTLLGMEEDMSGHGIQVFPNPTSGLLQVELHDHRSVPFSRITLHDATGREWSAGTIQQGQDGRQVLDLSGAPDGVHVLRVETPDGTVFQSKVLLVR